MTGLTQVVLGLFLQFAQPAEARHMAMKEAGVQDAGVAERTETPATPPMSKHVYIKRQRTETIDGKPYVLLELSPFEACYERLVIDSHIDGAVGRLNTALGQAESTVNATREGIEMYEKRCAEHSTRTKTKCTGMREFRDCTDVEESYCSKWETVKVREMRYDTITGAKREGTGWTERDNLVISAGNPFWNDVSSANIEFEDEGDPVQAAINALGEIREFRTQRREHEQAHAHDQLKQYADAQRQGYKQAQRAYEERQGIVRRIIREGRQTQEIGDSIARLTAEQQVLLRTELKCIRNPATCRSDYR